MVAKGNEDSSGKGGEGAGSASGDVDVKVKMENGAGRLEDKRTPQVRKLVPKLVFVWFMLQWFYQATRLE